jgi:hypothetical protein
LNNEKMFPGNANSNFADNINRWQCLQRTRPKDLPEEKVSEPKK